MVFRTRFAFDILIIGESKRSQYGGITELFKNLAQGLIRINPDLEPGLPAVNTQVVFFQKSKLEAKRGD
jgi:hypothetical protein